MTLAATNRGENNDTTTDITLTPSGNLAAGSLAVLIVGGDNANTSSPLVTGAVTDTQGNTWTLRQEASNNAGGAKTSVELWIYTTAQDGGTLTTGDTITVPTADLSSGALVVGLWEVTGSTGTPMYKAGNVSSEGASNAATITTDSITSGNLVIGAVCWEYSGSATADSDATNGTWSAAMSETRGTFSTAASITSQWKTVTGTGTQAYDVGLPASVNWYAAWVEIEEVAAGGGTARSFAVFVG